MTEEVMKPNYHTGEEGDNKFTLRLVSLTFALTVVWLVSTIPNIIWVFLKNTVSSYAKYVHSSEEEFRGETFPKHKYFSSA